MIDMERKHLAEADRHIAKCKDQVARQQKIIRQMTLRGQSTLWARDVLGALETALHALKDAASVSFLGPMPTRSRRYPRTRSPTNVPACRSAVRTRPARTEAYQSTAETSSRQSARRDALSKSIFLAA